MIRNTTKIQKLCWAVFIVYLAGLMYFTIFAESLGRTPGSEAGSLSYNLVPFTEIMRFWKYRKQLGAAAVVLNLFGNVAAFTPCGFLLPAISRRSRRFAGLVAVSFMISFLIECSQLILTAGSFDVDDLMLNTLGAVLGFIINRVIQRRRAGRIRERRRVRIRQIK